MTTRGFAILSVLVVLAAGAFAVDQRINPAPAPVPVAITSSVAVADNPPAQDHVESAPTNSIEAKPVEAKPVEVKPVTAQPADAKPVETKPAEAAAPPSPVIRPAIVTAPPASAPIAAAPPTTAPAPAPVVIAPPVAAPAPVAVAPQAPVPAPVVTTPPAPVVAALPAETPAPPIVAPPPVVMVPAPMPPEKPAIAETEKEKQVVAAKTLFAAEKLPSLGKAMAIGYYPRGCLSGGVALPVSGPTWQVMRVSRNRMWGHPSLVKFLETFAPRAAKATGWHGVLIGDMAQPRGGPLPFGHMSHQIGLDVDIWFMPMPGHLLSKTERDKISAISLVAPDGKHVNPKTWQPKADVAFIRTAAEQPEVERVLVNAAIKKEICRTQGKKHPAWMDKVRPWYGHDDHIHVRLACPPGSPNCRKQPPVPDAAGCGKSLDFWFSDRVLHPKYKKGGKPRKPITLADLPPACKTVLDAPSRPLKQAKGN